MRYLDFPGLPSSPPPLFIPKTGGCDLQSVKLISKEMLLLPYKAILRGLTRCEEPWNNYWYIIV
jgi:hypothetical protein